MKLNDNEISLLVQHIQRYGAHRFFQGSHSVFPQLKKLEEQERDKAFEHYEQIRKILKLE